MPNQSALPDVPLLFESASPSDGVPLAVCASCNEPIRVVYYEANGSVVCSRCRGKLEAQLGSSGGVRRFRRAFGFGLGAAIAGALFYYGFQVITGINAALPIIAGFSSIISVVLLGVGLMQAWRMNRGVNVTISGPYRIAGLPVAGEIAT